ncbi:MAG: U32 family peptidase [Eggerthellaceae bacterium]|nr:U32 family peptidase [Eggerthellaceae bacterium]
MKYSVPVNAPGEVAALVAAGADELYCGFQDEWWTVRYGDHDSASRRQGAANLITLDQLQRTADAASAHGVPLYLALNTRYTEAQLDHLEGLCDSFQRMGGTGVIVSDLGLLWRLRTRTGLSRTLSLLAVAQNAPTLRAFQDLGVTRVVFPRFINPAEAASLLHAVPGMQGEVMAFFDKCPLVDGYCRHRHGISYPDRQDQLQDDGAAPLYTFDTTYRTHACLGASCNYLEPYPCGACYLPSFQAAGVGFAKLGGRGRLLEERLRVLRFLKQAEACGGNDERSALYRQAFGQDCACYYGDAIQDRYAIEPIANAPCANEFSASPRRYLGSQTSFRAFRSDIETVCGDESENVSLIHPKGCSSDHPTPTTVLVPPLSDEGLEWFLGMLPSVASRLLCGTRLCVNDAGTLIELIRMNRECDLGLQVSMGTLLARLDDSAEVARFQDPSQNPSRPVWGQNGEPRILTYAAPPKPLVDHWHHPSAMEPSAQAALRSLTC